MEQAITYGDRLLMMHDGRIILNLNKAKKAKLTAADLVDRFHDLVSDRMMLN
jgi:putative ABC transport system ATP-binding protein